MTDPRFAGKPLPVSRFAGDPGGITPALEAALAAHAVGDLDLRGVQNALVGARLLVPTAAGLDAADVDDATGLPVETSSHEKGSHEKGSHVSVATFASNAGWVGLLAFTSMDSVQLWDAEARPVPVTAEEAADAALDDGRTVLVLDFAGPVRVALTGALLRALAAGRAAVPLGSDPQAQAAVQDALAGLDGLTGATLLPPGAVGGDPVGGDGVVLLTLAGDADPGVVAAAAAAALAADPLLRDRTDGGFVLAVAGS